jgi:hypothetical protein
MADSDVALAILTKLLSPGGYRSWYHGEDWSEVKDGEADEPKPIRDLTLDRRVALTAEEMELVERIGVKQVLPNQRVRMELKP